MRQVPVFSVLCIIGATPEERVNVPARDAMNAITQLQNVAASMKQPFRLLSVEPVRDRYGDGDKATIVSIFDGLKALPAAASAARPGGIDPAGEELDEEGNPVEIVSVEEALESVGTVDKAIPLTHEQLLAAGGKQVTCSACPVSWLDFHNTPEPILCSDCRAKKEGTSA